MNRRTNPPFSRSSLVFLAFALFNLIGVNLLLVAGFDTEFEGLSLDHTLAFLRFEKPQSDSWGPMMAAYAFLQSGSQGSVYQEVFFNQHVKFQYPLSSLLIFPAMEAYIGNPKAWLRYLAAVSWGFVIVNVIAVLQLFWTAMRESNGPEGRADRWIQGAVLLALALTYYPMLKAFSLGQIQVWLNAMFALSLLCLLKGKQAAAGTLCGVMCLIKPQYMLFLIWGLLRKQIAFSRACFAVFISGLALTILTFGPHHLIDYVRVTSFLSRHGEGFYPNQSVNGLLNRFFENGNNLHWLEHAFPPFHPGIYAATVGTSVLLIVTALAWKNRPSPQHQILDFCMVALVCTMASPIAWEHHYGVLLPIYAYVLPLCFSPGMVSRWMALCLGLSYVLTAHLIQATSQLADSWLNLAQSYVFFGACLLLICLGFLRRSPQLALETRAPTSIPPTWLDLPSRGRSPGTPV